MNPKTAIVVVVGGVALVAVLGYIVGSAAKKAAESMRPPAPDYGD